jgi:hypothetical protein
MIHLPGGRWTPLGDWPVGHGSHLTNALYHTLQCSAEQCSAVQCSEVQCSHILNSSELQYIRIEMISNRNCPIRKDFESDLSAV